MVRLLPETYKIWQDRAKNQNSSTSSILSQTIERETHRENTKQTIAIEMCPKCKEIHLLLTNGDAAVVSVPMSKDDWDFLFVAVNSLWQSGSNSNVAS